LSTNEDRKPLINDTLPRGSKKPYSKRKKSKRTAQATESNQTQEQPTTTSARVKPPDLDVDVVQERLEEVALSRRIIFEPNPGPQTDFLAASEQEVLYGGAAGGELKV
jgi:hypothetical protein